MVGFGIEGGRAAEGEKEENVVLRGGAWSLHSAVTRRGVQPALAAGAIQPPAQSVHRATSPTPTLSLSLSPSPSPSVSSKTPHRLPLAAAVV